MIENFKNPLIGSVLSTREGMATADNDSFLRFWFEVENSRINYCCKNNDEAVKSGSKWFPYMKGGEYHRYYGNLDYIVNWENDGFAIKHNFDTKTGRLRSHNYNGEYGFKEGVTWSSLSSGRFSLRYSPVGFLFDSKGAKGFLKSNKQLMYIIGLLNCVITDYYLSFLAPTLDYKVGDVIQIPFIISNADKNSVDDKTEANIDFCKSDWDSFETSWDFKKHPLI